MRKVGSVDHGETRTNFRRRSEWTVRFVGRQRGSKKEPSIESMASSESNESNTDAAATLARRHQEARRWSGLPVAASLALVAFAVIFGVYGPRVVDRGTPTVGTAAWELADEVSEQFDRVVVGFQNKEPMSLADMSSEVTQLLQEPFIAPDLSDLGYRPLTVQPLTVPGASRAALVLYVAATGTARSFLALGAIPDREQYVVYTALGRPLFLPAGEPFRVETNGGLNSDASATILTTGSMVLVVVGSPKSPALDVATRLLKPANAKPLASNPGD